MNYMYIMRNVVHKCRVRLVTDSSNVTHCQSGKYLSARDVTPGTFCHMRLCLLRLPIAND